MAQEAKGIRYQSEHFATVQGLMHSVNEQSLMAEHRKQNGKKAAGIDGVSKVYTGISSSVPLAAVYSP